MKKARLRATLALADGTVFQGYAIGQEGETSGEVVFNTSMTGYQEILTDPSYAFQMITFTYPHIGNIGTNKEDVESEKIQASGIIVHNLCEHYANYRAEQSLSQYLKASRIVGIEGIDTRSLVLHLRTHGAKMGVIASGDHSVSTLVDKAKALPSMEGMDLVKSVSTQKSYEWKQGSWVLGKGYYQVSDSALSLCPHVVAVDYGMKYNILRLLVDQGFRVTVVPAQMSASDILALKPDGIFLSNGPGDPAAVDYAIKTVAALVGKKPLFGICLGHQIFGLALGAKTFKLKFGHRGGNHPVRNELTKKVEITSQNHGFAVDSSSIPKGVVVSHINLNDLTVEGLTLAEQGAFSIQYHPEASPGPHDARYLFEKFQGLVEAGM